MFESRGYVFGYVLGCVCVFAMCAVVEFFLQVEKNRMGRIFRTLSWHIRLSSYSMGVFLSSYIYSEQYKE